MRTKLANFKSLMKFRETVKPLFVAPVGHCDRLRASPKAGYMNFILMLSIWMHPSARSDGARFALETVQVNSTVPSRSLRADAADRKCEHKAEWCRIFLVPVCLHRL